MCALGFFFRDISGLLPFAPLLSIATGSRNVFTLMVVSFFFWFFFFNTPGDFVGFLFFSGVCLFNKGFPFPARAGPRLSFFFVSLLSRAL